MNRLSLPACLLLLLCVARGGEAEEPQVDPALATISPAYDWARLPYRWDEIRKGQFPLTPVHWQRWKGNPVIKAGMNCRPIVWDETTIRVYFAERGPGKGIYYFDVDPARPEHIKHGPIGPILTTGEAPAYDDDWVLGPELVRLSPDHLRMYYSAKRRGAFFGGTWSLACADSHDNGATWTKCAGNPILTVTDDAWESGAVGFCSVERDEQGWRMWYLGTNQQQDARKQIGLATSLDGLKWERHAKNPVLGVDPANRWEAGAVAVPRVIRDGRLYKVWYCCYEHNNTYAIGCAESFDGVNWFRNPHNPVLLGSKTGWDSQMATYPGTIRIGQRYLMWYSGNGYGSAGVGLATAEVPRGRWYYRTGNSPQPDDTWSPWQPLGESEPPRSGSIQFAAVPEE